jgi:hypothetical protein
MSASFNAAYLRTRTEDELPAALEALRATSSDETITQQLINAVERGSLSTSTFAAWLGICKSPIVVLQSLRQNVSIHIRLLGIKQLKSGLESTQWQELWEGLGGTAGLLDIFSDLSVLEVRAACKAIGRSARWGDLDTKRIRVAELFQGLHPSFYPDATAQTTDLRPLTKFYQALVPSCTEELIDQIIAKDHKSKWQYVKEKELLEHHSSNIGRTTKRLIFEEDSSDIEDKERLQALSTRFPSKTSLERGFSVSMMFAFDLLREITETGTRQLDGEWVVGNLIKPLLKRAVKKKVDWSKLQEIATLALRYLDQHRKAAKTLTKNKGDVLHMVASCWSRRSMMFEVSLKGLLNMVFGSGTQLKDFSELLIGIPKSRRYALFKLCAQEVLGVDLDDEQDLKKTHGSLTPGIVDCIEAPQALGLFTRLRGARGDIGLVEIGPYGSVLATRRRDVREGDPDLYYLVLLNRNGLSKEAESYAASILEARKKNTKITSDREKRAEQAISVWACAAASGSLKLFSETVQWAGGFVRDQLTARKIFSTCYDETYQLLSGIPAFRTDTLNLQDLRQRVEHANKTMIALLDIACLALHEPFFNSGDWTSVINLFQRVVKKRMELAADLQKEMEASHKDIYYVLWEDTVTTLISAEKTLNEEDHERLHANTFAGVMAAKFGPTGASLESDEKATWMFFDNLTRARNQLWERLRLSRYPDVLTLPQPFPRGLPVQHLIEPWCPEVVNLQELAPYIFSRVEATLFVDPESALQALPTEEPAQKAIGLFVDSYQYAFKLYIPDACNAGEKEERLKKVWHHAIGPLSGHRIKPEEVNRYWKQYVPQYLQTTLLGILPKSRRVPWPVVPTSDDASEPQEWNPLEGRPTEVAIKARKLGDTTYIDLSTSESRSYSSKFDLRAPFRQPSPQVPAEYVNIPPIWSSSSSIDAEGGALAALLYLDAKYGSKERLLASPFPSPEDVRYPCIYLDEEFLSRDDLQVSQAAWFLSQHIDAIPSTLICSIATRSLKAIDPKKTSHVLDRVVFPLLRALSESDRAGLAIEPAIQVIINQPGASSWHSILFNNGFLQRIPASSARDCIRAFAEAVGKKLDILAKTRAREEAERKEKPDAVAAPETLISSAQKSTQPVIKITTLKSLAQLLHGSTYIGENYSLEILSDLSKKVSHIDVRLSIMKTLLSKLQANRPELWEHVVAALEPIVPLAGSLNEREPMVESDWTHAEMSLTVPEIQLATNSGWREHSPILASLVDHYIELEDTELLALFTNRIMLPTLETLKQQTARWAALFLRKYAPDDADTLASSLPSSPRGFVVPTFILSKAGTAPRRVPQTLLDEYVSYMMFNIDPPAQIRALNKLFQDDPAMRSKPEVDTWLALYGNEVKHLLRFKLRFDTILNFVGLEPGIEQPYITPQSFQESFLTLFTAVLWAAATEPDYRHLKAFTNNLTSSLNLSAPWWSSYGRPTIEAMIAYVNSIRTRAWERDTNRQPAVLPDTFPWRLLLLAYPLNNEDASDKDREHECQVFAQQLTVLLDEISGSLYHTKFAQIKEYTSSQGRNSEFRDNLLLTALHLGDISKPRLPWLTMPELLRVDLAADMMLEMKRLNDETLATRVQGLLGSWMASENEDVRRTGYLLQGELFGADGKPK